MANVKLKFQPSRIEGKEGTIYYQIGLNKTVKQISSGYKVFNEEWNRDYLSIQSYDQERRDYLRQVSHHIRRDLQRLDRLIKQEEDSGFLISADEIVYEYRSLLEHLSLTGFMKGLITQFRQKGKLRTAETYASTLRSFMKFRHDQDLLLDELDADTLMAYETYLLGTGLQRNSTSFYMRILRAVVNRAVDKGYMESSRPFRHVYTGIDKTVKRALPLPIIKRIRHLDLSTRPALDFARHLFLLSFYLRGMSFIDMAYLKKTDLKDGTLTYFRRKTSQRLIIRWEPCMQAIVNLYPTGPSPYLLPIITTPHQNERAQYLSTLHKVDRNLKAIGQMIGIDSTLTLYVARHSWASIARESDIPISIISEGLGHSSEKTTHIYLESLNSMKVDKANFSILKKLEK